MRSRPTRGLGALTALFLLIQLLAAAPLLAVPPIGFDDQLVANISSPTALAFTPDGRLLITSQTGQLRVYQNGALVGTPALDLTVGDKICNNFERGLLGVAVDPQFATNHYIYLYYTFKKFGGCVLNQPTNPNVPVNRVARYALSDDNQATGETVLVDNILSANGNHNAGDLRFGKDGYLYISVGDGGADYAGNSGGGGSNDAARDQFILLGKILRITRDGGLPPDNPWMGSDSARCYDPAPGGNKTGRNADGKKCQETFAWGLRNPFRIAFDPNASGTRFFINDVGQGTWEEIDEGQSGADYGWNVREGHCANGSTSNCGAPPAGMTNPIFDYGRAGGCNSITGGAFVPSGVWPAEYDGDYLYSDYGCGKIFRLEPGGGGTYNSIDFVTGLGGSSAVHMAFGPYGAGQALYYNTYAGGGQVRRIAHVGNRAPTAHISANPTSGSAPLTVNFDGTASSDPDAGDTLTFDWDFGDGSAHATTPVTSHQYALGIYTATLTVSDGNGGIGTATVRIDSGNTRPVPTISAPNPGLRYRVGQQITLAGSATDAEDGAIPPSGLSWRVTLHHNEHIHPFLPPTQGISVTITAPAPEDLAATQTSYLEIELTATDSAGATEVVTQELRPKLVNITFATVPAGRRLLVNNSTVIGTQTLVSWESYTLNVSAPLQTNGAGQWLVLASWADGGPVPARAIVTPAAAQTYTATFGPAKLQWLPLIRR